MAFKASTVPPPRRVTREAQKAETKLINLERKRENTVLRHNAEIAGISAERNQFIGELPSDVAEMLVAGGVIEEGEIRDLGADE